MEPERKPCGRFSGRRQCAVSLADGNICKEIIIIFLVEFVKFKKQRFSHLNLIIFGL